MVVYVLEYKFHLYMAEYIEKEVQQRKQYFDKIEDLISEYRRLKNARLQGILEYNTDFKVYQGNMEEVDIKQIDKLMGE